MLGIQCYAICWLLLSGGSFKNVALAGNDWKKEQQDLRDEISAIGKFFSGKQIGRLFAIMSIALLLFDGFGILLTYQYVNMKLWQLVIFYVVIAAMFIDAVRDFQELHYIANADDEEILARLADNVDLSPAWRAVTQIVSGGKCLLAVLLVLWTVFR